MKQSHGFSLLEMLTVVTILMVLSSAVVPIIQKHVHCQKELQLRRNLRSMREAIDLYKKYADNGEIPNISDNYGYPESLEILVNGVIKHDGLRIRFLRKIPIDPMTKKATWGLRSIHNKLTDLTWSGDNVYDIYSLSNNIGTDNIPYRYW